MPTISSISARWILDSRGLPTVYCEVEIDQNGRKYEGNAGVPSGASTGTYEALELRDGGSDFHGKGVTQAVSHVNQAIAVAAVNREFSSAAELDEFVLELDGTENKTEFGANAILAVSMAAHRAFASLYGLELFQYLRRLYFSNLPAHLKFPRLMCNVINGGAHADNTIDIQEFMVIPNGGNVERDVQIASEIYHTLKGKLKKDGYSTSLGDEGGFAPQLKDTVQALDYLKEAITASGYKTAECELAMDAAANEFYDAEKKVYKLDGQELSAAALTDFYRNLQENYPLISIEDGFNEDDVLGWQLLTERIGSKISLIGDDLFVTNPKRFEEIGLKNSIANGVLIKLNQIGTVFETCKMINLAKENGYITAVSHRSGETTDDFISDLAVAAQSEFIKLGAPARGERVAKFNRLLMIYEMSKNV